jgi:hypothetical protein
MIFNKFPTNFHDDFLLERLTDYLILLFFETCTGPCRERHSTLTLQKTQESL